MGKNSKIAWTDHTFNPWWGCTKVSAGCDNCYAEVLARRFRFSCFGDNPRRRMSEKYWAQPLRWNAEAEVEGTRRRVFCGSMCDVFENNQEIDAERSRLFKLIDHTPSLDWLLLTKRPGNMNEVAPKTWRAFWGGWPKNVWALATIERMDHVLVRMQELLNVPARIRGLSIEPILGKIDLGLRNWAQIQRDDCRIDWVIVGGESGLYSRPCDVDAIRFIVEDCRLGGVKCFVKQLGSNPYLYDPDIGQHIFIGRGSGGITDPKGGDPHEWPEDLRVREYPHAL